MKPAREELHRLADSLPDRIAEELAEIGRMLDQQALAGEYQEVTDPEEIRIVQDAMRINRSEPEFTPEQAKAVLAARRPRRQG